MKEFDVNQMPKNLQAIVRELPYVTDIVDNGGNAVYKVQTAPDPEWGNMHVPVSQWLLKHGANKGEQVYLKGVTASLD